jgi:hypothetical protein
MEVYNIVPLENGARYGTPLSMRHDNITISDVAQVQLTQTNSYCRGERISMCEDVEPGNEMRNYLAG